MRYRTLGLAAVVLLGAPLMASCRTPVPPPGTNTTTSMPGGGGGIPGPAPGQTDCGTITVGSLTSAQSRCFGRYHGGADVYFKVVDGTSTIVFSAQNHVVTITRATGDTVTKTTVCRGFNSQFGLSNSGLSSACPF
jgi:hypothetical protein